VNLYPTSRGSQTPSVFKHIIPRMTRIEVILCVTYEQEKALKFLHMTNKGVECVLRYDFDLLKLPILQDDRIRKPELSGVTVSCITEDTVHVSLAISHCVFKLYSHIGQGIYVDVARTVDRQDDELTIRTG
jgi:hypothetical protein